MAIKITELYNLDTSAGNIDNLTGNENIVFDPDPAGLPVQSAGMTLIQLRNFLLNPVGPGVLSFEDPVYSVTEDVSNTTVDIIVNRYVASKGAVAVNWTVTGGSASFGVQYSLSPSQGQLVFADGETTKTITLTCIAGSLTDDETVILGFNTSTFLVESLTPGTPDTAHPFLQGPIINTTINLINT